MEEYCILEWGETSVLLSRLDSEAQMHVLLRTITDDIKMTKQTLQSHWRSIVLGKVGKTWRVLHIGGAM